MSTDESDRLLNALDEWLSKEGYPLEMFTAAAFRKAGYSISMSYYYTDYESKERREVDVVASRPLPLQGSRLDLICHVECKTSSNKPWIIFRLPSTAPSTYLASLCTISSHGYSGFWAEMNTEFEELSLAPLFLNPSTIGHSVTQAFGSGHDVPFKAVMSCFKSSIDTSSVYSSLFDNRHEYNDIFHKVFCINIPIIVLEGKLFECTANEEGVTALQEVLHGCIRWKGNNPSLSKPVVYIVTKAYLAQFISEITDVFKEIEDFTVKHIDKLFSMYDLGSTQE
jgi:hypothetical protein